MFARTFDGTSYLCYRIGAQPSSDEETTLSVTLTPPLPQTGTIMTGNTQEGTSFTLAFDGGRLLYELTGHGISTLSKDYSPVNRSLTYKIDIAINQTYTTFTVSEQAGGVFDHTEMQLSASIDPHFESVCLGGVTLEEQNYVGTIENAFLDYYSLTEDRLFDITGGDKKNRSDVIEITGLEPVVFQKSHINATKISFDFKITQSNSGGHVVRLQNNGQNIDISTFNEEVAIGVSFFCDYDLIDLGWHHFELFFCEEPSPSITFTVDCRVCGPFPIDIVGYQSNPLQFGVPIGSDPFLSCFRNFLFEYRDREVTRPNLEAIAGSGFSFSNCETSPLASCNSTSKLHNLSV